MIKLEPTALAMILILFVAMVFRFPVPVAADGGPVVPDNFVWTALTENQQIALVRLNPDQTVTVDLFISMQDASGQSHEITYFLPLGNSPSNFTSNEQSATEFDRIHTTKLDALLNTRSSYKGDTWLALLAGPAFLNGSWLIPIAVPLMLSGCSSLYAPEATVNTQNSRIEIYGLDQQTDINYLIETAGLDSGVQSTLERLRGQKVAIIKIRTQAVDKSSSNSGPFGSGQPGLHFSWTAPLTRSAGSDKLSFTYPLGTGAAWAHPIPITRVYVIATREAGFTVQYPKLGEKFEAGTVSTLVSRARTIQSFGRPAYAVDEYSDSANHAWRATYTHSNSTQDIVITFDNTGLDSWFSNHFPLHVPVGYTLLISLIIAVLLWMAAWRYVVPRRLGVQYRWTGWKLWGDALPYPFLNAAFFLLGFPMLAITATLVLIAFAGVVHSTLAMWTVGLMIGSCFLIMITWLPSRIFVNHFAAVTAYPRRHIWFTYIYVVLAANLAYFIVGTAYSVLTGAI